MRTINLTPNFATPTDLLLRLENIHLKASNSTAPPIGHILTFEYPATQLLPENARLLLFTPSKVRHRCRPDPSSTPADLAAEFFAVLRPRKSAEGDGVGMVVPEIEHKISKSLATAIEGMRNSPGTSLLSIASFHSEEGLTFRIKLDCKTHGRSGAHTLVQTWELDSAGWINLIYHAGAEDWIYLIRDLVYRESERACNAVRNRLLQNDGQAASVVDDDSQYEWQWNCDPALTASDIFFQNLTPLTPEDGEALYDDLGDRWLTLILPCGHSIHVRKIKILAMGDEECTTYQCPTCSSRVLTAKDDKRAVVDVSDYRDLESHKESNHLWRSLDKDHWLGVSEEMYTFTHKEIHETLGLAQWSLIGPRLFCPRALTAAGLYWDELVAISDNFAAMFADGSERSEPMSPRALIELLCKAALSTDSGRGGPVGEVQMPPDWETWLLCWIVRTVGFLCERGCGVGSAEDGHEGFHLHDDGFRYSKAGVVTDQEEMVGEGEEVGSEDLMEDLVEGIEEGMGRASIEGSTPEEEMEQEIELDLEQEMDEEVIEDIQESNNDIVQVESAWEVKTGATCRWHPVYNPNEIDFDDDVL